ncbi:hypothetical protein DFH27DRAFT_579260 [Peziza echinospora]|nr:hypothetical protein DFH27DRAFT_579260 [Peziza echinospora]
MSTNIIVPGFSLLNRWLLYTSAMLSPAQFASGWKSNCPSAIGFLAYNWYTQIQWYRAVKAKQLHALAMLPVHYNTICCFTYLGGIPSGNYPMAVLLGLGSAGLMILNNISGWVSYVTGQVEGYGVFRFYFFGWRTLSPGWHKFFLLWQISDSLETAVCAVLAVGGAIAAVYASKDDDEEYWWAKYPLIPIGAAVMMFIMWPLVMWTELVVASNHIDSATDWVAVWLFIAQVATMIVPSCGL